MWHPSDRTRLNTLVFPFILLTSFTLISVIEGWDRQYGLWFKMTAPLFLFYMGAINLAASEDFLRRLHGPKRSLKSWRRSGVMITVYALFYAAFVIAHSIYPKF